MNEVSDQVLIQKVVTLNCHDSFAGLVKRHQSNLRYSLRQITGWDQALADDIAQETFIKAYQSISSFKGTAKFSSWLYRIAYNIFVSHFRVARNREMTSSEAVLDHNRGVYLSESSDLHRDLAKALLNLPPKQRVALHLHLHKQLTHDEICNIMKMPLGSVKTLITRGKKILQDDLSSWKHGDPT
jgi:RNA polymerase sigma factor (sigma-70 family)